MNIFRILGDVSHLLAMIILLVKIWRSKSCAGISGKSQILFTLVFTTRYLDLFTTFISVYNTVMKVIFLVCAYITVYMIYVKFQKTFDREHDSFRLEFLLVPVTGLSFLENHSFTPLEILWTFSIYLESVAILPQLFMISKTGEAETITTHYLFFLGLYRALYLANWIWRYHTENFYDQIAVVSGVVQTIFYCDFFYLYVTKGPPAHVAAAVFNQELNMNDSLLFPKLLSFAYINPIKPAQFFKTLREGNIQELGNKGYILWRC
ncbi:ER lumen protein retaining receptor 3 [Chelonia mydas]|uniref:ER lumen protein-retaining receptor n=1 Tax=Chelonia mydas TaxID=8469 RepID=M7BFK7_CHEMY|nr:ER lumen protein retaining receptor 3 [Chelonia mydas]